MTDSASAQEKPGQLVVGAVRSRNLDLGGVWVVDSTGPNTWVRTAVAGTPSLDQNPASLAADPADPEIFYSGTYGRSQTNEVQECHVVLLQMRQGGLVVEKNLTKTPLDEDYLLGVVPLGDWVYYLGRYHVGRVPRSGGESENLVKAPKRLRPRAMTTDGRDLFVIVTDIDIVRLGPFAPHPASLFTTAKLNTGEKLRNLAVDREGHILAVTTSAGSGSQLIRFDNRTGKVLNSLTLPFVGARAVVEDSATGDIYVSGATSDTTSGIVQIRDWKVYDRPLDNVPNALPALVVQRPRPVFYHGAGCADSNGNTPRLLTSGHPTAHDRNFGINLEDGTANQLAMLVFGAEAGQFQPLLPQDMRVIGAPGCFLDLNIYSVVLGQTDTLGRLSVPFRLPAVTKGADNRVRAQWLVADPKANNFGVVASKSATFFVRYP